MNKKNDLRGDFRWRRRALVGLIAILVAGSDANAQLGEGAKSSPERTQTIALKKGWNAVYLEVEPADLDPNVVFGELPVTVAARWFGKETPLEYISDPESKPWKREGWGIWYAANRPDAFLKTLHAVHGAKPYLLFAERDHVWSLTGRVIYQRLAWKADSFNLVGFGVDPQSPPTFEKFFSGSAAHRRHRIYRLVNGGWNLVTSPAAATMKAGEAFWVYCDGGSGYQGPVEVRASFHQGMVLKSNAGWSSLKIHNEMPDPVDVKIELSTGTGTAPSVPLAYVAMAKEEVRGSVDRVSVPLASTTLLPTLESGDGVDFRFELRARKMTQAVQSGYLTVSTEVGTRVWIPVTGVRDDLLGFPR